MMRKNCLGPIWFMLLLLLVTSFSACAKPVTPPFYKAEKGDVTIYVLGTMHVGKEKDYPLSDKIGQALEISRLVTELDEQEMLRIPALVPEYLCKTACLQNYMTPVQWQQQVKEKGKQIERLPPWLYMQMHSVQEYEAAGYSATISTESWLRSRYAVVAASNGAEIGLETAREQLDLLASFDDTEQQTMLQDCLNAPVAETRQMITRLYQYWADGDSDGMLQYYQQLQQKEPQHAKLYAKFDERILHARNQLFLDRVQPILKSGKPVFLAVGALHLGGKRGVIALLSQQGFTIQKL